MNFNNYAPISVIIPCYCCGDTIERAVKSVWEQSWKPYEVLLIDDGSEDNTIDVLIRLQYNYPKNWIKIISLETNKGPGYARNIGWEQASQEYIAFLDSDDAWHPKKIEIQLKWMLKNPDIVLTGHAYEIRKYNHFGYYDNICDENHFRVIYVSSKKILLSNVFSTPTVILKKDIPFRFYEKRFSEDYLLWLMIVLHGYKTAYIELPLTYLFKYPYGEGGLSGALYKMEKGELETYHIISKEIPSLRKYVFLLYLFSLLKFAKRLIVTWISKVKRFFVN